MLKEGQYQSIRPSPNQCDRTHHLFTQEILLQRSVSHSIVLECNIPVGRKRARQHSDIPKDALEGLIQDVAHLVLKVLRRNERIDEVDAKFAREGNNLATRAADV